MKHLHPATQKFATAVQELMRTEGVTYDVAWSEVKRRNRLTLFRDMEAVNESALPRGAEISGDGQHLTGDWPVAPLILASLGLPLSASREEFEIFKLASKVVDIPPPMAAKCIALIVQFNQLNGGGSFDSLMESVRRHFPKLFIAVQKISP